MDSHNSTNKTETEIKPKRSARLRNKSKTNSVDNSMNNVDNSTNNIENAEEKSISEVKNESNTLDDSKEEKPNSRLSSPGVGTRGRKTKKLDNEMSSSAPSTPTERSRRSSSIKLENKSEKSLVKSPRAKSKTRRTRGKKLSKSEAYVVEEPNSDDESSSNIDPVEKEIKRKSQSIVVEIEHKEINLVKTPSILAESTDVSQQDIEHSNISSEQTISSVDIKSDVEDSENNSQQSISKETIKKEEIKDNKIPKHFTIDIKSDIGSKPLSATSPLKSSDDNNNEHNSGNATSSSNNSNSNTINSKNTPTTNHYNSRSHSKRKKKLILKKSELSSRSVHIPAGLVNPFREKPHHQKVDEHIKEDMLIIRECIQSRSDTANKLVTEKQDIGNSHGTRRSLRGTSLANSNQANGANANGVSSPKARYSPEQLTKLNSYNQGVLPFYALDDISK
ncbi:hypothetical protein PIROE2DRAFT_16456, partial [Piromyces sp. E2]